jgi:hypothetical protein
MTKETATAYRTTPTHHFSKVISLFVALFFMMGIADSFAQSENESVTERTLKISEYRQKMMAGWIGQMVGVGWGGPTEFQFTNRIIPEDEVPEWKPEMVNVWGQDDLYVEMTFLRSLEEHGLDVSMRQAGIDFANSKYDLWHANKAGRDNLRNGIAPPDSSHPQFSSHADDIDYQIEADFSGLISPGLPNSVIALGEKFGRLMNYGDGVYAGQFVGCMYAEAFFEDDPLAIVNAGLQCIPEGSQYAEMVRDVITWYEENPDDWEATWQEVNKKYHENPDYVRWLCTPKGGDFNIDAKINGAYIVMGMLYSRGDFDQSIIISMRCGQDSDCNPSNAGGVLFTTAHYDNLADKYISALEQDQKFSYTEYNFQMLADVCVKLARQIVVQAGGRIETEEDGEEVFVIPVQAPKPSTLERSWEAGPIAGSTFSSDEFPHLKWLWIASLLLWIILLLVYLLLKENRNAKALWIIAAIIAVYVIWEILSLLLPEQSLNIDKSIAINQVVGLSIVFLLGERLARFRWPALLGSSFLIIIAVGFIGLLDRSSVYFGGPDTLSIATIIGGATVLVLGTTLTARLCQKKFSKTRFLLLLLVSIFIIPAILLLLINIAMFGIDIVIQYYTWFHMMIVVYTLLNYLTTLPLWILALTNTLYNERLRSCLDLPDSDGS